MPEEERTSREPRTLGPGSVETIRNALEFCRSDRPVWFEHWFAKVAERGYLEYEDIEGMDARQVEAVRHLLADQIMFWRMKRRKAQASGVSFLPDDSADPDRDLEWRIRLGLAREALADLCRVYSLPNPIVVVE
jgi:hypothetical protein